MFHKTPFERMIEGRARIKAWKGLVDQICQVKKIKCNNCNQVTHAYYKDSEVFCSSCRKRISRHE